MNKLNEKQIIEFFQGRNKKKFVPEDVEIFKIGKTSFAVNIDTLVESTDIVPGTPIEEYARKSIIAAVSDFAVKGIKPKFAIISVVIPKKFSKAKVKNLSKTMLKTFEKFDIELLGGDTNEGKELVIHVAVFGKINKLISRKGAKTNDVIVVTGPFGYTAAGLQILLNKKKANTKFQIKAKNAFFKPKSRIKFGIDASKYLTASMDSSDGLSSTLHEIAFQNKKQCVITRLPANADLVEFSRKNKINPLDLVFHGGEEYEIVATVNRKNLAKLKQIAKKQKTTLIEIGHISNGKGVVYKTDNEIIQIQNKGWLHFRC